MSTKARIRERLDTVQGATTAIRLVLETIRACLRYGVTGLASEAAFFMLLSAPARPRAVRCEKDSTRVPTRPRNALWP